MSMYRREWDCCGSVTETDAWEPESCPFCTPDKPVASAAPSGELAKVHAFLLGEAPWCGAWFGEKQAGQDAFWWRSHLRAAIAHQPPKEALTDEQVFKIARYLSDFSSAQCNVDKDDAWKIYGDDEIALVRAALASAGVPLKGE